ncbi:leucyl/phenylalanyl-tRNA--protein transferase [Altererythrobacter aquiaggeris]|uniref:leucyl/phenylalanyl-tRNA--protein transferase n=1 Tax=Aestuarierythrobacter aquiaggeris TaxID=1898396 RepID=UPI0030180377
MHSPAPPIIPPDLLLSAYRSGIFPMADSRDDHEVFWVEPKKRAIIPLDGFRCSASLARTLKRGRFAITCNKAFSQVISACSAPREPQDGSWISHRIEASYVMLHALGHAHSIECWQDGALVGGLYGVGFDGVFCGESMFRRVPDASKVALATLVAAMRHGGHRLLDCQFMTDHLASLGAAEIPQTEYVARLTRTQQQCRGVPELPDAYSSLLSSLLSSAGASSPGKLIAQSLTQTS